ncbi:Crp/Fnr family transcriptional regulator [Leptolyngbya cf. ectocarpi LEGE 11479]|uniref:Crp/Fnr family transcriptional regulator n=1 Tax=Leptolyngbya cf. ectocarpi LEGE 11479 TaxID=1828722 RepID=A0A928ZWW9_LEPEC|nr:Crp/Fnr family transcriptional regulator [Leptolyngbya ectocarpi]MBE9069002.1 Crp/Fnr family transcriptional regulator [Leptolyngbya cf. ectocarpi LEGE 11479]
MKATISQLSQIQLFAALSPDDLEQLQPHTQIQQYQREEIVLHEGDPLPMALHVLVSGVLQVQKSAATGKETILRTLRDGDIFAAPALFGDAQAPATVIAMADCQVLTLSQTTLLNTIQQTPEVALRLLVVFNQRLQQLHTVVHGLVSERAVVRLAQLIQYSAWQYGTDIIDAGEQLRIKLPYYQMARSIGITYEECARLMKKLDAIVKYGRGGKIVILNSEGLETIAAGEVNLA